MGAPFLRPAVCQDILLSFSAAGRFFDETGFSGKGVSLCPVHEGGIGRRCGREHLNLLGQELQVPEGKRPEPCHVVVGAPGMGGDEVVGEKQILFSPFCKVEKEIPEGEKCLPARFPHLLQDMRFRMFRRELHLSRNVMTDNLLQVFRAVFLVGQDQVMPYPRGNKDLFNTIHRPERFQQRYLLFVIYRKPGAYLREEASFVRAAALLLFSGTVEAVHIGRRSAYILYDPLKAGVPCERAGFIED